MKIKKVQNPIVMPVTVLVCETEYDEQEDLNDLIGRIGKSLIEEHGFRKEERKRHREGFLDLSFSEDTSASMQEKRL